MNLKRELYLEADACAVRQYLPQLKRGIFGQGCILFGAGAVGDARPRGGKCGSQRPFGAGRDAAFHPFQYAKRRHRIGFNEMHVKRSR